MDKEKGRSCREREKLGQKGMFTNLLLKKIMLCFEFLIQKTMILYDSYIFNIKRLKTVVQRR